MKLIFEFHTIFTLTLWISSWLHMSSGQAAGSIVDFVAGISGMINTARSIHSMTSSMTSSMSSLLSSFVHKPSETTSVVKREGDGGRQNYSTVPVMSSNIMPTRSRQIPKIWDMASGSYLVEFMLFNRESGTGNIADVIQVGNASQSTAFDKTKKTKLIIHDYNQTFTNPLLMKMTDGYLRNGDYNVIMADWIQARKYSYTVAARVSEYVGVMCGRLLVGLDADPALVHVIGFGLGAHAAGVMGFDLHGAVGRITGLDPSLPLFRMATENKRLDEEDAIFVDVYHSDGGDSFWHANHLGMGTTMGHVDVYINQGIFQPNCPNPSLPSYEDMYCSHLRALEIFVESVIDRDSIIGCSCDSWTMFLGSKCDCTSKMVFVGDSCPKKAKGKFYLVTGSESPYGLGRKGAFPVPQLNTFQMGLRGLLL